MKEKTRAVLVRVPKLKYTVILSVPGAWSEALFRAAVEEVKVFKKNKRR